MKANCSRYSGVHSAVAPQSMSTMLPVALGTTGAKAARRMPRIRLTIRVAADSRAPVDPAETKASPLPLLEQVQAHGHGGVRLFLKGPGGVVLHVDDLTWPGTISIPWGRVWWPSLARQAVMSPSGR